VGNRVIRIRQDDDRLEYSGAGRRFITHYFSLDTDLTEIVSSFDRDPVIHAATKHCHGLRLIRQPPWECLISYICSTNSNIPMIKKRIEYLSKRYGTPLKAENGTLYGFPDSDRLTKSCDTALSECRMGYRGPYVKKTACSITDVDAWEHSIASLSYPDARRELMKLQGVGPKAADCILLFSFQMYEAFPVDVWIRRIMREHYLPSLQSEGALTSREYTTILAFAKKHFGKYCGYAQEYLYAAREINLKI
jgi:N-glycosylase/DNA lyase